MIASILSISNGKLRKFKASELESAVHEKGFLWIDVEGNNKADFDILKELFHLHPLTIENLVSFNQRPKAEEYPEYIFLILHPVTYATGKLEISEIDFILGHNYLITSRLGSTDNISVVSEKISKDPMYFSKGPSFLLYSIIDAIVDDYFPPLEKMAEELDALETEIFSNPSKKTLNKLFRLKRNTIQLRKTVNAQRDMIIFLSRQESDFVLPEHRVYFRDVYEHLVRVSDSIDTYREIISDSMDAYLSVISNRLNEVMKVLTIIATIILPMSLVAGFYGMNVDFPEYGIFGKPGLYFFALGLMLTIVISMLFWFRKKGWF
jgi:magnesium transporter